MRSSGLREAKDQTLVCPKRRNGLQANELSCGKFNRLPPCKDGCDNVWRQEGKRQDATDLTIIDTQVTSESSNGLMTFNGQQLQPVVGPADDVNKANIHVGSWTGRVVDDERASTPRRRMVKGSVSTCEFVDPDV